MCECGKTARCRGRGISWDPFCSQHSEYGSDYGHMFPVPRPPIWRASNLVPSLVPGLIWISCHKGVSSESLFLSRFVVAQSLKEPSAGPQSSLFRTKFAIWIKIKAAILHFDDVTTVNCALCDLIAHLTFQMRKVSVQEIQVRPPDVLHRRVWTAGHETNAHPLSRSWTRPQAMRARQKCLSL